MNTGNWFDEAPAAVGAWENEEVTVFAALFLLLLANAGRMSGGMSDLN